jgi:SpoVK/Ycf46/Vps4 family AAA+-type ATPase
MPISDILTPRPEVTDGEFQGVLQAHKVGASSGRLESDPSRLLSMTYPSDALELVFEQLDAKFAGDSNQGGITLNGPYGAGKSHALLALYHALDSPAVGQRWLDNWNIDATLPENSEATVLSTSQTDADRIWEPILRDLGREDLLAEIDRYPTSDHLESLTDDGPVAIFFDEIETWWGSFGDDQSDLLNQNKMFLQNLLEVAADPEQELAVFVTLLDENEDIKRVLDRTKPYGVDLNDTGDRERIILHRLFETSREEADESAIRSVVREYIDGYGPPVELPEEKRYENRMVETYPFHPALLDLLDNLFQAARERQSTRGTMGVLADAVEELHDETNLIVTSDVDPRPFRGFNKTLYDRFVSDRDEVSDIQFGTELLQTTLLYTFDERSQEATVTNCLLGVYKPDRTSIDRLDMSLRSLYGTAHYLDRDSGSGPYYITEDPKLTALVTREQERIESEDIEAVESELAEVVREEVWSDGTVHILGRDEVPDDSGFTVAVALEYTAKEDLRGRLDEFFDDRKYQNSVQVVTPTETLRMDGDIQSKTARLVGAKNLRGKVDDENDELSRIVRDERRELRKELESRYGQWVKWTENHDGELALRRISVEPSVGDLRDEIGRDKTYIGEKILDQIAGSGHGVTVESLRNDFDQFRRLPVLLDDETFYSTVRELHRGGDVVLESDRSNYYVGDNGEYPPSIEDGMTIHDPDELPDIVFEEDSEIGSGGDGGGLGGGTDSPGGGQQTTDGPQETIGGPSPGGAGGDTGGLGADETGGGSGPDVDVTGGSGESDESTDGESAVTSVESVETRLEGNGPRVLRSQAEARLNGETDTVTGIDISYDGDGLSKDDLLELIETLPDAAKIDVDLEVARDDE